MISPLNILVLLLEIKLFIKTTSKHFVILVILGLFLDTFFLSHEYSYAASTLQNSDYVLKINQNPQLQGSYKDFLLALAQRETGQQNPPNNIENQLGFIGKYQFGEALLKDLGYYDTPNLYIGGENGVDKNYWRGTWEGKNMINSKQDFLNNKNNVQEKAIQEAFQYKWGLIKNQLNGRSIKEFIGQRRGNVVITTSGILAAAHLCGEGGVAKLLLNNQVSQDENGTSILAYLKEFGGFQTPFD
ncbi:hypothetical protein WKK05_15645 [Nostoc sp. UHCC 0302]|uniref:hypothetical protein n=1 Tax=Nostoc sp. UHCC 0302 TaxID=3134896 RepID=UPI00311CDDC4